MSEPTVCHAVDCNVPIVAPAIMCFNHWQLVPQPVKQLLWRHQVPEKYTANPDYIATVFVAISCVAIQEGKGLPSLVPKGQVVQ
jgi:hypothetical protein